MSLRAHLTGDVSDARHSLPVHFSIRREINERGNGPVPVARDLACTNAPAHAVTFIISYQSAK